MKYCYVIDVTWRRVIWSLVNFNGETVSFWDEDINLPWRFIAKGSHYKSERLTCRDVDESGCEEIHLCLDSRGLQLWVKQRKDPPQLEAVAKLVALEIKEVIAFRESVYNILIVPGGGCNHQVLIIYVIDSKAYQKFLSNFESPSIRILSTCNISAGKSDICKIAIGDHFVIDIGPEIDFESKRAIDSWVIVRSIKSILEASAHIVSNHSEFFLFQTLDEVDFWGKRIESVLNCKCSILDIHPFICVWEIYVGEVSAIPGDGFNSCKVEVYLSRSRIEQRSNEIHHSNIAVTACQVNSSLLHQ